MPILPAEPDTYPENLFSAVETPLVTGPWWALYTMARREKELMRRLRSLGLAHYGPLVKKKSRSPAGRIRVSHVPLFAGYVFLRGDEGARQLALTTNCISQVLSVPDGTRFAQDLLQIQRLIACEAPLTPEARIEPGQRVRVRGGAMEGLEGTVIRRRGKEWLLVMVEFLQQGASVLLEDYYLERI
jgi:transcriptional antiterminator RfaH